MTVTAALILTLCLASGQAQDARAEAERLAATGAYQQALDRFQAIVAANPDDLAARLWIARLHLRMGHARRAAGVFESIVAADAKNVDALVGLGLAQLETGDWDAAADSLKKAEALAPDRTDVLAAQGRLHGETKHATLALAYYGRALALEPTNAAIRAEADALKASRAHRVTAGYNYQKVDPILGDFNSGLLRLNARASDTLRLVAQGEMLRFDDSNEGRGGAGIEWFAHPRVELTAGALFGGETWLPELDVYASATLHRSRAHWSFTARFFNFEGIDLWIAGPGLAFDVSPRVTIEALYLRGRTDFDFAESITSDNFVLGLHGRPSERARLFAEYRYGIDRLDWLTLDRLTADDASGIGLGGAFDLTPFVTLGGEYDYQSRSDDVTVHRGRGKLTFRF